METSFFSPPGGRVIPAFAPSLEPLTGPEAKVAFDEAWPLLEHAIQAYGDTHHKEHVWSKILDGQAQLWTLPEAALVSEIRVWPTGLREAVGWLAAGDIDDLLLLQPRFERWAKANKCKRVGIVLGRPEWASKFDGFEVVGARSAKEL